MEPQEKKPWYLSKIFWTNLIMGVVAVVAFFIPEIKEQINAEVLAMVFSFVNVVLRLFFTKAQIT